MTVPGCIIDALDMDGVSPSVAHHVYHAVYNVMWQADSAGVVFDYAHATQGRLADAARRCAQLACTSRTLMCECLMWIGSGVADDATELTLRLVAFASLGFTAGVQALLSRHPLLSPSAAGKALHYAAMHNRWSVVDLLVSKCGGETLSVFKQLALVDGLTEWYECGTEGPDGFYVAELFPETDLLSFAASAGQRTLCARLLEADVQVTTCSLSTAAGAGHLDILRMMLEAMERDPRLRMPSNYNNLHDVKLEDALEAAAEGGHPPVCELLLLRGADVRGCVDTGSYAYTNSPLGLAAWNGHLAVCELLLDHGASVYDKCVHVLPLTLAAGYGHLAICKLLLRHSADADADADDDIQSNIGAALTEAAGNGHLAICELLLQHGDYEGDALEVAAGNGHLAICEMLLRYFAICELMRRHGAVVDAAMTAAADKGHLDIYELLRRATDDHEAAEHARAQWWV